MLNCLAMGVQLLRFVVFWALNVLLLWLASSLFPNAVRFDSVNALILSGLLFGIAHAVLKPILILLTLPVTLLTLGLFLIVINALILLLVAWVVPSFHVAGFWQAAGVGLFISVFSVALSLIFHRDRTAR
jgi:putative membrane protein